METPLQMCDRHVTEGLERLVRHDVRIASLAQLGSSRLLDAALDFQERLLEFQADAERHAARLREQR